MRKQLLAMTSCAALGFAVSTSGPASAIQPTPGLGNAADANVIQVKDREGGGFGRSGGGGPSPSGGMSRGNFSAQGGKFSAQGGKFEARGQVQSKSIQSGGGFEARGDARSGYSNKKDFSRKNFDKKEFSGKNFDKKDFPRGEVKKDGDKKDWGNKDWDKKDFSRWKGNKPHLALKGWDRHHKHRFFGAFLIGVPFGYYLVESNPCYDWIYGPQGWGYYWNYDRCPVVPL